MRAFAYKRHPGFASPLIIRRDQWAGTYQPTDPALCACAQRRGLYLSHRYLYYYSREHAARIYQEAHPDRQRELILSQAAAGNEHDLSLCCRGPACCQPTTMSYRRPVFLTRTWMRVRRVICRLISPGCAISAALTLDVLCGEALRLNWRRFLLINCSCIVKFIRWEREREREREMCVF